MSLAQCGDIMLLCTTDLVDRLAAQRGTARSTAAQAPHPPHEGAERGTDGFSSEKFTKVQTWTSLPRNSSALHQAPAATPASQEPNGSEILVRCLQAEGVKYLWGYPGGAVLYIYDALYKQDTIQHVLVRHEQAAVHAADGYARATGDVGVALVTSGPGVTNAVTGIATAYMDSIPMVIITGQVPTPAIGLDAFQECDTVGITRPIVKHNFLVKDVRDLAMTMKKAFHIARTGRPGPVVVDIPEGRVAARRRRSSYPATVEMRSYNPVRKGHGGQIRKAVQLLLARQAALHLHRRRRGAGQCVGRAARAGRPAGLPVHQHADGPGRLSRPATRSSSACWACTAPTKPT